MINFQFPGSQTIIWLNYAWAGGKNSIKQAHFKQRSQSNTFDISVHATRWKIKPHSFNINAVLWLIAYALLMNLEGKVLESRSAVTVMEWCFIKRALLEVQLQGTNLSRKTVFFPGLKVQKVKIKYTFIF